VSVTVETRRLLLYSVDALQANVINSEASTVARLVLTQESGTWTTSTIEVVGVYPTATESIMTLTAVGTTAWFPIPYPQLQLITTTQPDAKPDAIVNVQVVMSDNDALLQSALDPGCCPDPEVTVAVDTSGLVVGQRLARSQFEDILAELKKQTFLLQEMVGDTAP
jgi:hypothetical protein